MSRNVIAAIGLACFGFTNSLFAETLVFEADESVVIIRMYDQFGMAAVEFLGEAGAIYQCLALNTQAEPIASTIAMAEVGQIIFQNLDVQLIESVKCRRSM